MTKELQKHLRVDSDTGEVLAAENDFAAIADELVAAARGQGIELTGPNGLLTGLTSQVLQTALGSRWRTILAMTNTTRRSGRSELAEWVDAENGADRGW